MREDMYKVIVERPRHGRYMKGEYPCPRDLEESPNHEGLKKRHRNRKYLNENLNPLERFLTKHVNRPWDKVYSELCNGIDRRNTVQQHIHQHIDDFVVRKVVEIDGELHSLESWGGHRSLAHRWQSKLYVDPATGILRKNVFREKARQAEKRKRSIAREVENQHRRIIDAFHQLHQIDGIWFFVTLAKVPDKPKQVQLIPMDVIRKKAAWDGQSWTYGRNICSNKSLYGDCGLYAVAKRQLNSSELKRYGLHNN